LINRGSCWPLPLSQPYDAPPPEIAQDFASDVVAGRAGDAASGMPSRAAQIEPRDRATIIRVAQHRPRREYLPQIERAVEYVAADEAECSLEIEREKIWRAKVDCRKKMRAIPIAAKRSASSRKCLYKQCIVVSQRDLEEAVKPERSGPITS